MSILFIYVFLQFFDFFSTDVILGEGGKEENRIDAKLMKKLGRIPFLFIKTVLTSIGGYYLYLNNQLYLLEGLTVFYAILLGWFNLRSLIRIK